jgi:hypothetical protein
LNGRARLELPGLLDNVNQLVGQQALSDGRIRLVLSLVEEDVRAIGVGVGIDGLGRFGGCVVGVDSDLVERLSKT